MRKIFILALFALPKLALADPASLLTIEPDNFNLLYKSGMRARFTIQENAVPANPAFQLQVTAQQAGVDETPVVIPFANLFGTYLTKPLAAGLTAVRIQAHLIGPAGDAVVQDEIFDLEVQP